MIKLKHLIPPQRLNLTESIFDKGIFKAIFFSGIPGAGKSYTISKISAGTIQPRIVNFDKYSEFLNMKYNNSEWDNLSDLFIDTAKRMTESQLALYVNSMLPIFVDTTSNKPNRTIMRNGVLKSFGYDTGMVWINTDLDVALKRIKSRHRDVPESFVIEVNKSMKENIEYYKQEFGEFFIEINNNYGELTNDAILQAFRKSSNFFTSDVNNPIGRKNREIAKTSSGYLVPRVFGSIDEIRSKLTNWY